MQQIFLSEFYDYTSSKEKAILKLIPKNAKDRIKGPEVAPTVKGF